MSDKLIGKVDPDSLSWDEIDSSFSATRDHYGRLKQPDEIDLDDDTSQSKVFYKLDVPKGYRKRKGASFERIRAEIDTKLERGDYVTEQMFHTLDQALEIARSGVVETALKAYAQWESCS